jgi:tetratricopeptide (TPR) repeat protein
MRLAADAAPPQDLEAQAWYSTQLAELSLKRGHLDEADRDYRRAIFLFANYPLAMVGRGKVEVERGHPSEALEIYLDQLKRTPTLDLAGRIGDVYASLGNAVEAERYYQLAEEIAGPGIAQTEAALALFLADHDRKLGEAVATAQALATKRHDIFTEDALAWAYFKTGRIEEAYSASQDAMRTGSRDARILAHATAILNAKRSRRS